jgi:hypothetical protein
MKFFGIISMQGNLWQWSGKGPAATVTVDTAVFVMQYIKVGIVGGSDLVKIQEQLGDNGEGIVG